MQKENGISSPQSESDGISSPQLEADGISSPQLEADGGDHRIVPMVQVDVDQLRHISEQFLLNSGFNDEEARLNSRNLLEAELLGKKSHGIIRLKDLRRMAASGDIRTNSTSLTVISHSPDSLYFDAEGQNAAVAIYRSLDHAFIKLTAPPTGKTPTQNPQPRPSTSPTSPTSPPGKPSSEVLWNPGQSTLLVGIKDMAYASGYIGDYARIAAERGYIFLSFFNSPPVLIPHGSAEAQWGTNPLTFAFPGTDLVYDAASSATTWGETMYRRQQGHKLPKHVALDSTGQPTQSPAAAMAGGLLSMGEHKGSGMGLIVELMAGALTGSRVGSTIDGGWGGCYLLVRPDIFRKEKDAPQQDATHLLDTLNASRPREGFDRVLFPGQHSHEMRTRTTQAGSIALSRTLWEQIVNTVENSE